MSHSIKATDRFCNNTLMVSAAAHPVDLDHPWAKSLQAQGYSGICQRDGLLCAIKRFNFTTAIVVGLDPVGYQRRYCFEHAEEAERALAAWNGKEHPGGDWIKCKGGGIDLLNPALGC